MIIRDLFKFRAASLETAAPPGSAIGGLLVTEDTGRIYLSRIVDGAATWLDGDDPFAAPTFDDVVANFPLPIRITAPTLAIATPPELAGAGLLKTLDDAVVYRATLTASGWQWIRVDDFDACNSSFLTSFAMSYVQHQLERLRSVFDFTRTEAPDDATGSAGAWTWEVPPWVKRFRIEALGSGAGGASGPVGPAGALRLGGVGGAGGGVEVVEFATEDLPARVLTLTVPAGGAGGAAVASNTTPGNSGNPGSSAVVESDGITLVRAFGGGEQLAPHLADTRNYHRGGDGWAGLAGAALPLSVEELPPIQISRFAGPGGGGGGGITADDEPIVAQPGVTSGNAGRAALITAGTTPGEAGASGPAPETGYVGAAGAGGAAGDATHDGGPGGTGSIGGGGGGGGAAPNDRHSGAGGAGGPGFIRISVLSV